MLSVLPPTQRTTKRKQLEERIIRAYERIALEGETEGNMLRLEGLINKLYKTR